MAGNTWIGVPHAGVTAIRHTNAVRRDAKRPEVEHADRQLWNCQSVRKALPGKLPFFLEGSFVSHYEKVIVLRFMTNQPRFHGFFWAG